ncbi:hypothetical protein SCHPADRAFT_853221 [Schizopora paradoxa]|uniref:SHSP domain-containing protein n=1 Tax=Schizopora paradoxa TaxID=27342 RepID=A0A0H2RU45_9AGAM|nr:hypothetical protein SCHPADRAFT_853221 [Schizopora paradoxa]
MSFNHTLPLPMLLDDSHGLDQRQLARGVAPSTLDNALAPVNTNFTHVFEPSMNIHENPVTNMVTALFELPGMRAESVHVEVYDKETLVISGERTADNEVREQGFVRRKDLRNLCISCLERRSPTFRRPWGRES